MSDEAGDKTDGIVVDRSRITHRQSKHVTVLGLQLQRASRDLDDEAAARILDEMDSFLAQVIVSVPDDWLPKGVKVGSEGWLDHLSQEHYEAIMEAVQPESQKKGG